MPRSRNDQSLESAVKAPEPSYLDEMTALRKEASKQAEKIVRIEIRNALRSYQLGLATIEELEQKLFLTMKGEAPWL